MTRNLLKNTRFLRTFAFASVVLAFGGIVLARAEAPRNSHRPEPQHVSTPTDLPTKSIADDDRDSRGDRPGTRLRFSGPGLSGEVGLSQSAVPVGGERHVYAEIRLNGEGQGARVPAAISVVVDKSGSMTGEKIAQARRALLTLLDRMDGDDYISVITYSDGAHEMQSLERVREVEERLRSRIARLGADGGTNIRAGLVMGARSLSEAPRHAVRRVLLLSDGQDTYGANARQSAGEALDRAGTATISTLGIGHDFDERFMRNVAEVGDGNYAFLANTDRMRDFLANELEQTRSTSADDVRVELRLPDGWRVARAFGAEAEGTEGLVTINVGAVTSARERRIVLDLIVDADEVGSLGSLSAEVRYNDTREHAPRTISAEGLALRAVPREEDALASRDMDVFARSRSVELAEAQTRAVDAWRNGRRDEAASIARTVATEARALQAAAPAAAPMMRELADDAARAEESFETVAPASAAGAAFGRGAAARSSARSRGMSAMDAEY